MRVCYENWWEENTETAFFTKLLSRTKIESDICFYSVFGDRKNINKKFDGIKIFFSAENHDPIEGLFESKNEDFINSRTKFSGEYGDFASPDVDLALGLMNRSYPNYMRIPIGAWCCLDSCGMHSKEAIKQYVDNVNHYKPNIRRHGMACIARHDGMGTRTMICDQLEKNFLITYAGSWRNNTDALWKRYADDKIKYLNNFRFCICAENSDAEGYCTEKLYDAISAGTIPIYYGAHNNPDPDILNKDAIIFWDKDGDNILQIEMIKRLTEDDEYYKAFVEQPKFKNEAIDAIFNLEEDVINKIADIDESRKEIHI